MENIEEVLLLQCLAVKSLDDPLEARMSLAAVAVNMWLTDSIAIEWLMSPLPLDKSYLPGVYIYLSCLIKVKTATKSVQYTLVILNA